MTKQENFKMPLELQEQFHTLVKKRQLNRSAVLRSLVEQWMVDNASANVVEV